MRPQAEKTSCKRMKNYRFEVLILAIIGLVFGCEQLSEPKKSKFKVINHYTEFSTKMENNDTLNIEVILSICTWREYDQLQITKYNDSIYIQLKEKLIMEDAPIHFSKVAYQLKNDTLNLENLLADFDTDNQKEMNSLFFIIINPKEKDTLFLRTTGLGNRGLTIERYQKIMANLYPNEMAGYLEKYFSPPPPPPRSIEMEEVN